jgi:hypothetical protein
MREALGKIEPWLVSAATLALLVGASEVGFRATRELWRHAQDCAAALPESLPVAQFVTKLTEVIDVNQKRVSTALHRRLPGATLATLHVFAAARGLRAGLTTSD